MNKKTIRPLMLVIYGPTGVGKTDLALTLADCVPAEIINMDVGQFYTPLSIGTAKPDWKKSLIPHHLFDILDEPVNYSVNEYRTKAYATIEDIIDRGKLPILVGGSGFYLHSLLYQQPIAVENTNIAHMYSPDADLWHELHAIDPVRAAAINPSDTYRIERALGIWHTTGKLPSSYISIYQPEIDYVIIFLERDRQELKERINARVKEMLDHGWIEEARNLMGTPWEPFLRKKNLIGYGEIFDYLAKIHSKESFDHMVEVISAQTRQYAKRQFTFWRKLEREIKKEKQYTGTNVGCLEALNLTTVKIHLCINELLSSLKKGDR